MNLSYYKPDFQDAEKRWQAYFQGELIDRPPVVVTAPRDGFVLPAPVSYRQKIFSSIDQVLEKSLARIEATYWGGDAVPSFYPSFGPDEIAVFCGAEFRWSQNSPDTNWSVPFITDWDTYIPVKLQFNNHLFDRQLEIYRQAAKKFNGTVALVAPDMHTNMDLLSALRGPQKLCMDLLDCPEIIDRAMTDIRKVMPSLWSAISAAGDMPAVGYALESHALYSRTGSATLQCDFSIMMSPKMFRRWVIPALEEEARVVGHVVYHWDGPGALVHKKDLIALPGLHTLSFVPGDGNGSPVDYIDLLKELQAAGKSVHVWGTPDECKRMHKELMPHKVFYCTETKTRSEAEKLLEWFTKNT